MIHHRVVDASTLIDLLLGRSLDEQVRTWFADEDVTWHAPDIIGVEITSVLRRLTLADECTTHRARAALEDFHDLGLTFHSSLDLLDIALSLHGSISAYDAVYVALAMALPAPLVTADRRLGVAAADHCDLHISRPA